MKSKDIKGFNGHYKIFEDGRVLSISRQMWNGKSFWTSKDRFLKHNLLKNGYIMISLKKNKKTRQYYLHRILAEHFLTRCKNKTQVNHIDGDKLNNNLSNLEWVTPSENMEHSFSLGLHKGIKRFGEQNHQSKLDKKQVKEIRRLKGKKH